MFEIVTYFSEIKLRLPPPPIKKYRAKCESTLICLQTKFFLLFSIAHPANYSIDAAGYGISANYQCV